MKRTSVHAVYAALNLAGYLGVIGVNALANALPINGKTTGALSDNYPNLFTPAGITFSIWGVIYILLAVFAVFQLGAALQRRPAPFLSQIGLLFVLSCAVNIGWIFAWHHEMVGLSLLLILVLLGSLLAIYLRLRTGRSDAGRTERYMVHVPFSFYLGWITIATIANVTALLVDADWGGFGLPQQFWAVLVTVVGILIGLAVLIRRRDVFFALVVDWALMGILIKRLQVSAVPDFAVVAAAAAGLAVITCAIIIQLFRRKVY